MQLTSILKLTTPLPDTCQVEGITHDSRAVSPGWAFVAVPGFVTDGITYVPAAAAAGASLIIAEKSIPDCTVPCAVVPDARAALADLACALHDNPSHSMHVLGLTGTNGKTTTSYALSAILKAAYGTARTGLMTTAETIIAGEATRSLHTTPEATDVQATLARMKAAGVTHAIVEVSSHGIALHRITGTQFAGAAFTNLTRDHLDLHGTMEEYYITKRRLFEWVAEWGGPMVANGHDPYCVRLAREIPGVQLVGEYSDGDLAIVVSDVQPHPGGTTFTMTFADGTRACVKSPLLGDYNVENVSLAIALAVADGIDPQLAATAVATMGQVPGRFEPVIMPQGEQPSFAVIVDYAHTEIGLEGALKVSRSVASSMSDGDSRVIVVFGACGDRDRSKRPLMAEVACRLADLVIITSDDPYREDPDAIAAEVATGIPDDARDRAQVIVDRREAIDTALRMARRGDLVLIAGKGHETVQHTADGDIPFHDATVAAEILRNLARA